MRAGSKRRREAGFALVEALASLVVVGMIALMILSGVATGRRVWEGIDARETVGERLENAQAAIRDRVEQAFPAIRYLGNPVTIAFDGTGESLDFLASPPEAQRPSPLRRYSLGVNGRGDLVFLSASDVATEGAPRSEEVILKRVRALDIAYFGSLGPGDPPAWRRTWRDQTGLPQAIRIRVAFEPGDARAWPDLIIRTRATIDTACLINLGTHHCKGRA